MVLEEYEWTPVKEHLESAKKQLDGTASKGIWHPFFAAMQICVETEDAILYQKNTVSRDLGLPAFCEVFASGKNIRDRYRLKSRPMSIGPLAHLHNLKKLFETGNKAKRKVDGKVMDTHTLNSIWNRYIEWVKAQSVSLVQKRIIDQIAQGDWSMLPTLAISYISIKPHIEHHFVLLPEMVCVLDNFSDE
ncbi:hypothetical protein JTE90_025563 [Oedothorax gibbosus]|uniref:Uncharacterized protein n=1 Tax=Oedothorax gibbosus TaxID=931172 RepID=A0AAV6TXV8_9ARAC|nr:hypothetical protein JTE90_025563 [Oedothorax gibbosus]